MWPEPGEPLERGKVFERQKRLLSWRHELGWVIEDMHG